MSKILFLTNVIRRMGMMQQTMEKLQKQELLDSRCACFWITTETNWDSKWQQNLDQTDFLLMKWMGAGLDTPFLQKLLVYLKKAKLPFYIDAAGAKEGELSQGLSEERLTAIKRYASFGGEINYLHLWQYLQACLKNEEQDITPADPVHWCGIYHPEAPKVYRSYNEYAHDFCKPGRLSIGILFYRDEWVWQDLTYQAALIKEIEKQGMNAVCVFSNGMPSAELGMPSMQEVFASLFAEQGIPVIDVLLNVHKFSFAGSGTLDTQFFKTWNIPIIAAYSIMSSYEEWKHTFEGMNAMEVSISVALPEFDGVIHGVPVACKKLLTNGDVRYLPIPERVTRLVSKAKKWANLRHKDNAHKKIAIIFHNYPPKNSNIGSAVGLDTIESIRRLLKCLQERGYLVDTIPTDGKEFIQQLTRNATNDRSLLTEKQLAEAQKLSTAQYQAFFADFEQSVQEQMHKDWGKAPGAVMEYDGSLLVPGTMNGNIFVTVQPPRGFGEDPEKIYHDPFCTPTHHYLGFYHWLRDIWQVDAVAHIGTHGSLEWLPGKNAGLDCTCYPDLALGDLPNVYPYHMTITGEGIQAKRRGAACLVEHLPAPQTRSGVYDELEELEKAIDEYLHFEKTQPENLAHLEKLVRQKIAEANLENEVHYDAEKPFKDYIMALHNYLTDLKNMECHIGLHILGQPPEAKLLTEELLLLARLENGNIPSLNQAVAGLYGFDYYQLLENSGCIYEPLNMTYGRLIDRISEQCREIVIALQQENFTVEGWQKVQQLPWIAEANAAFKEQIQKLVDFICTKVYPNLLLCTQEMENILRGLEGQFVEPGPSGSPSSGGADLLPTGRNFYGIDPRTLPTPAAWEIGKTLGEQAINRFIAEEGHYPENVGMVLWSGSNMRSHGQCLAEFLYLMGIKPKYQQGSQRVNGLEVIPLNVLKRPRIDVTARISGLFRDSLPGACELLDKAVLLAAGLDEDIELNFVRKHVIEDTRELQKTEGMTQNEAWREAAFRVFGDQPGAYGAGVAALLDAKNWETVDDIAEVYVRWGAHAYGGESKGKFLPQMFRKRMGSLDIAIKNEDNHDTNMLSSDDYNAYHGGMIACCRSIKGVAPKGYAGDSTDRTRVATHSVQEQAKRIFRSEAINPKFIKGMMEHGYKGAADMANMLAHSFQWDATSEVMEDWMYEKYAEKYAFDPEVQAWLKDVNPWALQRMTEILLEAEQRHMWQALPETKAKLQELYLSMEGELEERADVE